MRRPGRQLSVTKIVPALAALAASLWLDGCSYRSALERFAPKAEVEFAERALNDVKARRMDKLVPHLAPRLASSQTELELATLAAYFPAGEPRSFELIGANVGTGPGWWRANLSFQYEFADAWIVANVVLAREDGGDLVIEGLHLQRLPDSLERINAFTTKGKGGLHWAFLFAGGLVLSFVLATFVVCVRSRNVPRKWLWALLTLVGVTGLTINWTTGQVSFQPLSAHLLGAGAVAASPYAPWLVTVSFPLGAVLSLARLARTRHHATGDALPRTPAPRP